MKHFALILLAALTWSVNAQITYPYNPDGNGDQYIAMYDLQDFLSAYGQEWIPGEIVMDSIPLSAYLEAMEALILANAMPAGTNPGQFLRWNGEGWELVMPKVGCTLPEACNYDETAHVLLESMCVLPDACGVCGGPGAVYDCGCADIPEGECDCDGNVVDALGVCGGTCEADEDGDGICDDGDSCVGQADECGVCNGPGAIYDCGCTEPVEGTCDCDGNVEDVLGVCGGSCTADEDFDGICDDVDDCVGAYDGCGVCNGPGPVLGCGCNDIPEGFCDCNGNVLDAVGTCGGACQNDLNGDGICDDGSIPGCTYSVACNYDPSASINDGSCDFTSCYGCTDIAACNYDPSAAIDNGVCWYAEASYDCDLNCLIDTDEDGVCDGLEVLGCTDEEACNFEPNATEEDGSCDSCTCANEQTTGCTDSAACNFSEFANCDDGSCTYPGCNNPLASNYDETAECSDGSCIVNGCTVDLACNYEPTANVDDNSCEFGTCPGCNDPNAINYNPTSSNSDDCRICGETIEFGGNTYGTSDINGVCWMTENTRNIPFVMPQGECLETPLTPSIYVEGYSGNSPDEAEAFLNINGAYYNYDAYLQHGCPSGFRAPRLSEIYEGIEVLGQNGFYGFLNPSGSYGGVGTCGLSQFSPFFPGFPIAYQNDEDGIMGVAVADEYGVVELEGFFEGGGNTEPRNVTTHVRCVHD